MDKIKHENNLNLSGKVSSDWKKSLALGNTVK